MTDFDSYLEKLTPEERRARFVGEELSKEYAKYRPNCTKELIEQVLAYAQEKLPAGKLRLALDVGCGTGQCTNVLSPYFEEVHGIDVSPTQITEANNNPEKPQNVCYKVGVAEELPFEDKSIDLVIASVSFHWFDREAFLKEVKRVLVPNGVLAIVTVEYETTYLTDPEVQKILDEATEEKRSFEYWRSVHCIKEAFRVKMMDFSLPELKENKRLFQTIKLELTVAQLIKRFQTSSHFTSFHKRDPEGAEQSMLQLTQRLLDVKKAKSPEDCVIITERNDFCLVARV